MSDCPNSSSNDNNNGLTDTQKEDSTAFDSQGRACDLGSSHDECPDQG
jgi:hypothetical protein